MTQRLYTEMSADEQALWVQDFAQVMEQCGERLALLTKGKATATTDDAAAIRRIFSLLSAWPFAQDFCEKAQRYGDYMARTSRLPIYIEKVKEKLADGLTMTDTNGRLVAYVNPSTPMRRRGRPTKEEVAARLRGETITMQGGDDAESKKRRTIAKMLGLEVVIHGDAPREKNNAELAADRAARKAEYEKQNPSLFPTDTQPSAVTKGAIVTSAPNVVTAHQEVTTPPAGSADRREGQPAEGGLSCPTMSEVYQDRIKQDRLRLSDLAWLCSDDLRKRIETVRALRVTAESASERAKTMAELGQPADAIAPYAQQAKEAVEGYLAIYAAVDEELAIQFKRLSLDQPYINRFKARFKGVDIEKVLHICRPYYEKIREQEKQRADRMAEKGILTIDERIRLLIERDNPEYAAKMKAEEEKKQELQALHRYIMRKDKGPSDERCKTLAERIERVRTLAGDAVADSYLPILNKTIEENKAFHAEKDTSGTGTSVPSADAGTAQQEPVPAVSAAAQEPAAKERKKPGRPKNHSAKSATAAKK